MPFIEPLFGHDLCNECLLLAIWILSVLLIFLILFSGIFSEKRNERSRFPSGLFLCFQDFSQFSHDLREVLLIALLYSFQTGKSLLNAFINLGNMGAISRFSLLCFFFKFFDAGF